MIIMIICSGLGTGCSSRVGGGAVGGGAAKMGEAALAVATPSHPSATTWNLLHALSSPGVDIRKVRRNEDSSS